MTTTRRSTLKEWREWGKKQYQRNARMIRNNSFHPDYDTHERKEAFHDATEKLEDVYLFSPKRIQMLRDNYGYTDKDIMEAKEAWVNGYKASRKWYKREDAKQRLVLDEYKDIFTSAEIIAKKVDVSDIKDGYPCGRAIITLDNAVHKTPLGKAIAHFNTSSSDVFKYKLPIKTPVYGQSIEYDEKINKEVCDFLRKNGVIANSYSMID